MNHKHFNKSKSASAIPLRKRLDLTWSTAASDESSWSVVKDPISVKYYRLRDDERFVWDLLSGDFSWKAIVQQYNARYSPRRITVRQLQQLVISFFRQGLVYSTEPGQAQVLVDKDTKQRRNRWWQRLNSWLYIRFPGIPADRLVTWIEARMRPLLRVETLVLGLIAILMSLGWLLTQSHHLMADILQLDRWISAKGIALFTICLAIAKTLHELGHGVLCKRFGGECHEIGVVFMFFVPCLYCDTSDAWLISNRWKRVAIGAAGIFVELLLGSCAVMVWHNTHSEFIHWLSVDLIVVCLIGTVLINANPLLRYDGYYILSDLFNIPNLSQEAADRTRRGVNTLFTGKSQPTWPERSFAAVSALILYAIASLVYRLSLLFGIAWLILVVCRAWQIERTGWQLIGLAGCSLLLSVWVPRLTRQAKQRRTVAKTSTSQRVRQVSLSLLALALLGVLLFFPIEQSLYVTGEVHPSERTPIVSSVEGRLVQALPYGKRVDEGEQLFQLENFSLARDAMETRRQVDKQSLIVQSLERTMILDAVLADQLPTAKQLLATLQAQHDAADRKVRQLSIKAPQVGLWFEPLRVSSSNPTEVDLRQWSGLPNTDDNQNCWIKSGTILGWLGTPNAIQATVTLRQSEIEWVEAGQAVSLQLEASPSLRLRGKVLEVSVEPAKHLSPRFEKYSGYARRSRPQDNSVAPLTTSYAVRIQVDPTIDIPSDREGGTLGKTDGLSARIKIHIGRKSLGERVWRWLSSQIRFLA